ncbi:unnamed protein product [Linum tenue]|uniref:Clp ATPase C-terminal domain-containing protein n=1 Tax=Linum tenue TaxID=586396 RepID=A0AAV0R2M5_9ROSI|nr:unnamed protein product [Linum tenue]
MILSFRAGNARQSISHFLSGVFGAEISNRVDEILMFNEVTREDVEKMVDFMVSDFAKRIKRLGERSIEVEVTEGMKNRVVEEGYDPPTSGGAKPLKSAFARLVENPLADAVLEMRTGSDEYVVARLDYHPDFGPSLRILYVGEQQYVSREY